MKKLLGILVLGLFLITPSQADDIRDLMIEKISVGDSLLNFYSKEQIEHNKDFIYKNKKFASFSEHNPSKFERFDQIQVHFKNNDNKYKIYSITGTIFFANDMPGCMKKKDTVINDISDLVKNAKRKDEAGKHQYDKSGKSLYWSNYFIFDSGDKIDTSCTDWSPPINWRDRFKLSITLKELRDFINFEAYK